MVYGKKKVILQNHGDIIFFDWEQDGHSDHVGIVEKSDNRKVYTIEGNSNDDMCRQKEYDINSTVICGYGTPNNYFVEIVNSYGITVDKRNITDDEINKVIYTKQKEKQR